ncbi:hypothetical protein NLJ89_g11512 [Agrocybe chaxingu]|uniref:Uncharacterized protein n=1 Tax=Agrocybe chaxingu TaxID=84603 RepID=A0A9W8JLS0_9AGAR|nr:hypothetical protein NLJ89_g11512 [Agrocybe chaxingu]
MKISSQGLRSNLIGLRRGPNALTAQPALPRPPLPLQPTFRPRSEWNPLVDEASVVCVRGAGRKGCDEVMFLVSCFCPTRTCITMPAPAFGLAHTKRTTGMLGGEEKDTSSTALLNVTSAQELHPHAPIRYSNIPQTPPQPLRISSSTLNHSTFKATVCKSNDSQLLISIDGQSTVSPILTLQTSNFESGLLANASACPPILVPMRYLPQSDHIFEHPANASAAPHLSRWIGSHNEQELVQEDADCFSSGPTLRLQTSNLNFWQAPPHALLILAPSLRLSTIQLHIWTSAKRHRLHYSTSTRSLAPSAFDFDLRFEDQHTTSPSCSALK